MPAGNLSFHVSGGGDAAGIEWLFRAMGGAGRMINCAGFLERSGVNGPGLRAVVWVQGCPIGCQGCFNRDMWSFAKKCLVHEEELAERILAIPGIAGVTFSGGEPFCQAAPLAALAKTVRESGRSVVTFSGYPAEKLLSSRRKDWRALLQQTDLLVAGPFVRERRTQSSLCASANQQILSLSERIAPGIGGGEEGTGVEFTITSGGEVVTTGFPERAILSCGRRCT
ncbi:MAG: anaerobic ribonucleotide reductase-activating protein [Methanoregulaceae archaeon PtaB.Bin056]|nr:MAG: anaerobic ribonucleotide reductase-activating protein [Methanoregulaceae archaeon PtaB.Bin056]